MELGKIIDDNSDSDDNTSTNNNHTNKNGEALSKGGILEKVSSACTCCRLFIQQLSLHFFQACEYISHLKSVIKSHRQSTCDAELSIEVKRLMEENELLRIENTMLKRKYMEDIGDEENCLMKRPKSETDDFKLDIEFGDSLPCDDLST